MMRRLQNFLILPHPEKKLFFEALLFIYWAKVVLLIIPFKGIVRIFANKNYKTEAPEEHKLMQIKHALARANRFTFWKNKCIVQSMAARWMLKRRKIASRLSIGVLLNENKQLDTHAWIAVYHFEIINKNRNYKELFFIE